MFYNIIYGLDPILFFFEVAGPRTGRGFAYASGEWWCAHALNRVEPTQPSRRLVSLYPPSFSAVVPRPLPARPGFHCEVQEARGAVLIREGLSLRCPSFAASGDRAGFLLQAVGRVSGHRAVAPGISVWGLRLGGRERGLSG
jgi:hypothetical protein